LSLANVITAYQYHIWQFGALFELNQSVSYKRMNELVIIWESLESLSLIILGAIICSDLGVGLESQPVDSVTSKKRLLRCKLVAWAICKAASWMSFV